MDRLPGDEKRAELGAVPVCELLAELGRRFRLRYGRLEVAYHDGRPSPRVTVEHRIQHPVDGDAATETSPLPSRRGKS